MYLGVIFHGALRTAAYEHISYVRAPKKRHVCSLSFAQTPSQALATSLREAPLQASSPGFTYRVFQALHYMLAEFGLCQNGQPAQQQLSQSYLHM